MSDKEALAKFEEYCKQCKANCKDMGATLRCDQCKVLNAKRLLSEAVYKEDAASSDIPNIIEYLNIRTDKAYKASNKNTIKLIRHWYNEGYSLGDFIRVIAIKSDQWLGTEFERYLRPQTLFGPKFESYAQEDA